MFIHGVFFSLPERELHTLREYWEKHISQGVQDSDSNSYKDSIVKLSPGQLYIRTWVPNKNGCYYFGDNPCLVGQKLVTDAYVMDITPGVIIPFQAKRELLLSLDHDVKNSESFVFTDLDGNRRTLFLNTTYKYL